MRGKQHCMRGKRQCLRGKEDICAVGGHVCAGRCIFVFSVAFMLLNKKQVEEASPASPHPQSQKT